VTRNKHKNRKINKRNKLLIFFLGSFLFFTAISCVGAWMLISEPIIDPLAIKDAKQIESLNKALGAKNIYFSTIEQNNDLSYKVSIKDNGIVYISQKKDLTLQIDSLQLIINRLTIEGKRFKSLDFRFEKPVISY